MSKIFRNTAWTKRDPDCTNIVACIGTTPPDAGRYGTNWQEVDAPNLAAAFPGRSLDKLWIQGDVAFYGYL